MLEKVKDVLLDLTSAVQARKLYSKEHPKYSQIIEKIYKKIKNILNTKDEFIIGIINDELAWESEILFDISRKTKSLLIYLQNRDIEKIKFYFPLEKQELKKFISFLSLPKKEHTGDIQEYLKRNGIKNIQAGKIRAVKEGEKTGDRHITKKEHYGRIYHDSIDLAKESANKILNDEEIDYLDLRFNVLTLLENYKGNHNDLINIMGLKRSNEISSFHTLNVGIVSMFFASHLGISKDRVIDIGISALFHDIGKRALSEEWLKKKNESTKDEYNQMRDHCLLGSIILLKHKISLGILPPVVAFEHHLRYDKKGYPKLKYPLEPHLGSKIISICDAYDSLFQKRTAKKTPPPEEIYEVMNKEKGHLFDPELVDSFFEIMGIYPLGTIVLLNDNRIGYVKKINRGHKFRPVIKVLSPKKKSGILDLSEEDPNTKILKSLDPLGEGKKYTDQIDLRQE